MGGEQSSTQGLSSRPYAEDLYMQIPSTAIGNRFSSSQNTKSSLHRTDYSGTWSVLTPECIGPDPRSGHFSAYDPVRHVCYVGYGSSSDGSPKQDLWELNTITKMWREIPLKGDKVSSRSGSRATLIGSTIVVFGGYSEPNYYADLHIIDPDTGIVSNFETSGTQPSPRSSPIIEQYADKIYVWGGFNGTYPSDLYVLDILKRTWTAYPQELPGRSAIPWARKDNIIYSYGGSKTSGLVTINLDECTVRISTTTGAEPPCGVLGAGMVIVDHFLFFFGGKAATKFTLVYACDLTRMWWFVFHVRPDGHTVSASDGNVSELGLFMLPRIHTFGMAYEAQTKEIIAYLSQPERDPSPLFLISISEALGILHLRDDLLAMIKEE